MKLFITEIFVLASLILTSSCKDKYKLNVSSSNQDSIIASKTSAKNNGEKVEGRFLNIQKLTDKTYKLSIRLNQDSIAVFETYMPLDQNEISLLRKEGNNILLTYKVYQNSVTEKPIRMVQYMHPIYESKSEPISCLDWIGFYGKAARELDSIVNKNAIKVKSEGYDKYNSANKLEGVYVLTDKNIPIDSIGSLAKYLAYKLCLSDNKKFNGVLMNCQRRKIQVVIARSEKNYTNEAWAVVYNIFPANKKGELITLDFIK